MSGKQLLKQLRGTERSHQLAPMPAPMAPPVVKRSSAPWNPVYDGAQFLLVLTWLAPYFVQIPVNANIIVTSTLILYVVSNTLTKNIPIKISHHSSSRRSAFA